MAQKGKKQVLFLGCQVTKQYVNNKTPRKCCNRKNYFTFFFIFQSSLSCYRETAASSIFRFEKRSYCFTFDWYKDIGDSFQVTNQNCTVNIPYPGILELKAKNSYMLEQQQHVPTTVMTNRVLFFLWKWRYRLLPRPKESQIQIQLMTNVPVPSGKAFNPTMLQRHRPYNQVMRVALGKIFS